MTSTLPKYGLLAAADGSLQRLMCTCLLDEEGPVFALGSYNSVSATAKLTDDGQIGLIGAAVTQKAALPVYAMAFDNRRRFLWTVGGDKRLTVSLVTRDFDLRPDPVVEYQPAKGRTSAVAVAPNGHVATGDWSGEVRLFKPGDPFPYSTLMLDAAFSVTGLIFDGQTRLIAIMSSGVATALTINEGRLQFEQEGGQRHSTQVSSRPLRAIVRSGDRFVIISNDARVNVIDRVTLGGICASPVLYDGQEALLYSCDVCSDGRVLVTGEFPYATILAPNGAIEAVLPLPAAAWAARVARWHGHEVALLSCYDGWLYAFTLDDSTAASSNTALMTSQWHQRLENAIWDPAELVGTMPEPSALLHEAPASGEEGQVALLAPLPGAAEEGTAAVGRYLVYSASTGGWVQAALLVPTKSSAQGDTGRSGEVDGRHYDYVIDVDMPDGSKAKLAFNKGANPHTVAADFVARHHLDYTFCNEIVDFIRKNTGATVMETGQGAAPIQQRPPPPVSQPATQNTQRASQSGRNLVPAAYGVWPDGKQRVKTGESEYSDVSRHIQELNSVGMALGIDQDSITAVTASAYNGAEYMTVAGITALAHLLITWPSDQSGKGVGGRLLHIMRQYVSPVPTDFAELLALCGGITSLARSRFSHESPGPAVLLNRAIYAALSCDYDGIVMNALLTNDGVTGIGLTAAFTVVAGRPKEAQDTLMKIIQSPLITSEIAAKLLNELENIPGATDSIGGVVELLTSKVFSE